MNKAGTTLPQAMTGSPPKGRSSGTQTNGEPQQAGITFDASTKGGLGLGP